MSLLRRRQQTEVSPNKAPRGRFARYAAIALLGLGLFDLAGNEVAHKIAGVVSDAFNRDLQPTTVQQTKTDKSGPLAISQASFEETPRTPKNARSLAHAVVQKAAGPIEACGIGAGITLAGLFAITGLAAMGRRRENGGGEYIWIDAVQPEDPAALLAEEKAEQAERQAEAAKEADWYADFKARLDAAEANADKALRTAEEQHPYAVAHRGALVTEEVRQAFAVAGVS